MARAARRPPTRLPSGDHCAQHRRLWTREDASTSSADGGPKAFADASLAGVAVLDVLRDLAVSNGGLVTPEMARTAGVGHQRFSELTRRGSLARVARGVYSVAATNDSPPDPRPLTMSRRVVLSHASAAAWLGVDLCQAPGVLHVTAERSRGASRDGVPGMRLHRASLSRADVIVVRGVRVTTPLRTALDMARQDTLEAAVTGVDSLFRERLLAPSDFTAAAFATTGPGARQVKLVAGLADPSSGSVLESLTRVLLWRHDLTPERTQFPLEHPRTGWIGYLDFAWPSLRVALECDGYEWHADRGRFQADRRRWSALNRADWLSGVVTWFDVTADPSYVVALTRDLIDSRRC